MEQIIRDWLETAKWAPSGGNIQPWMTDVTIDQQDIVFNIKIRSDVINTTSAADQWGAGALIGLGCFAENLIFLAPAMGYQFARRNFVAGKTHFDSYEQVLFKPVDTNINKSAYQEPTSLISRRTTNRWPFAETSVLKSSWNQMRESLSMGTDLALVTDKRHLIINVYRELAFLRMHNDALFSELMHEIYDSNNDINRQTGLPFLSLALPSSTIFILKCIQKFGLHPKSRLANGQSVKDSINSPLTHCGDIIYISTQDDTSNAWNQIGHTYQKLNFALEKDGLAQQPIAYNLLAYNHLYAPNKSLLNPNEGQKLNTLALEAKSTLGFDFSKPGLLVRVGRPTRKAVPSPRRSVDYTIRFKSQNYKHTS